MYRPLSAALAMMLLNGCASQQDAITPSPALPELHHAWGCSNPLAFYETTSLQDSAERRRQKKILAQRLELTHDACDRFHLALLMAVPDSTLDEKRKAVKLLDRFLTDGTREIRDLRLARLLREQLQLQIFLADRIGKQKIALEEKQQTLQQLQERNSHLESLIEQLKTIERNFNEQEQAIIAPSAPAPAR